jgi:hypothetical protein
MKKIYMGIAICLALATVAVAEDSTAIAYWSTQAKIDSTGKFTGNGAGLTNIGAGSISSTVITNVLAAGMVLPAVDFAAATNGAAGNIASGNLAVARITNALATAVIPLAGITNALVTGTLAANLTGNIAVARITNALTTGGASIGGNIPIAATTNAYPAALNSTNDIIVTGGTTSTVVILNGRIISITAIP